MTAAVTTEVEEAKAVYRRVRTAFLAAMDNEDAAFARYFAKRASGVRTNGAAVSRLSNLTNYLSAELSAAQGPPSRHSAVRATVGKQRRPSTIVSTNEEAEAEA